MKPQYPNHLRTCLAAALALLATGGVFAQEAVIGGDASGGDQSVGIVRITKPKTSELTGRQVTPTSFHHRARTGAPCDCQGDVCGHPTGQCQTGNCPNGQSSNWCDECWGRRGGHCRHGHGLNGWCRHGCDQGWCHHGCSNGAMCDYLRCKFGYFIPTGAGGAGIPWHGKYARVYPQDPHYFDQRDGQAWAAQGYGIPMAVPLAPVVGHTYNYGWGIPSSRLTPVSHPAY